MIESLFIDNEREAGIWREPLFIETLANGVAHGIREALGLSNNNSDPSNSAVVTPGVAIKTDSTVYTVQVGAFTYIENARQRLLEAQRAGFSDAYIYNKQL